MRKYFWKYFILFLCTSHLLIYSFCYILHQYVCIAKAFIYLKYFIIMLQNFAGTLRNLGRTWPALAACSSPHEMSWISPSASKWTRAALENSTPDNPQTDSLGRKWMCWVTFHFLCCEQVTNPQKLIWILSSKSCENTPPSLMPSSSSPQHTNCYWCDGRPHWKLSILDRALSFARQLNETLQEARAGMHSSPTASSALDPIWFGISTWRPKVPLSQGWKKSAAWHKKEKNLVGMCTMALLESVSSSQRAWREWSAGAGAAHPAWAAGEGLLE